MLKITEIKKEEAVQALELIHEVYREIPEKSWFSLDGDKELLGYMTGTGFALKAVEESKIAAVFVARTTNLGEEKDVYKRQDCGCARGNGRKSAGSNRDYIRNRERQNRRNDKTKNLCGDYEYVCLSHEF